MADLTANELAERAQEIANEYWDGRGEGGRNETASVGLLATALARAELALTRGSADPDYSLAYQDEYQRLWHREAAVARTLLAAVDEALALPHAEHDSPLCPMCGVLTRAKNEVILARGSAEPTEDTLAETVARVLYDFAMVEREATTAGPFDDLRPEMKERWIELATKGLAASRGVSAETRKDTGSPDSLKGETE